MMQTDKMEFLQWLYANKRPGAACISANFQFIGFSTIEMVMNRTIHIGLLKMFFEELKNIYSHGTG